MRKEFKTYKKVFASMVAIFLVGGLTACSVPEGSAGMIKGNPDPDKLQIVTTIFPEYDWAREIVGCGSNSVDKSVADKADITMLLDNGVDLHSYQPTAADIARISTCDVFIYVGGESDFWVEDALKESVNKDMIVIDLLDELGDTVKEEEIVEGMQAEDEEEHEHDHEDADEDHEEADEDSDEEEGPEYDEHVWLSLKNSEILCTAIADGLKKADPDNADAYSANLDAYIKKLSELDDQYQKAVDEAKYDTILFGDRFPFRYMVDDYGLNYYAAFVGCSAETEASFETIIFLSEKVDELGLPAIFTIEGSDGKIANTIKNNTKNKDQEILAINSLQSVVSGDVEKGTTYLSVMKDNLEVLKKAID